VAAEPGAATPASRPDGSPFDVTFLNQRPRPVELSWMTRADDRKSYGLIPPGESQRQQARPGAVWQIALPDGGETLGHFVVGDRSAKAIVEGDD
jgi:hypothetical protein